MSKFFNVYVQVNADEVQHLTSPVAEVCQGSPALYPSHKGAEVGRSGRRRIERPRWWSAAALRDDGGVATGDDSLWVPHHISHIGSPREHN